MEKSIVSIAKGEDVEKMLSEVLSPLGGVSALIKPKSTVVIKPNAGHEAPAETSVNTNPELVAAVIKEIRKAGPKEIILAEASAIGCDTMECLEVSGILKAVPTLSFSSEGTIAVVRTRASGLKLISSIEFKSRTRTSRLPALSSVTTALPSRSYLKNSTPSSRARL